jgi:REP element-mobilizing transposase RayT
MARTPRLDRPGALHHVILRGVLGLALFMNDSDRRCFLALLAKALEETGTSCLAWSLMTNHVHLLVETGDTPLSQVIHRVATAYAKEFNRRRGGQGHVFQGRFISIPVESEAHFLELVRYIHGNPLRANLLTAFEQLATYPWTGHAALMGNEPPRFLDVDRVLGEFGRDRAEARAALTTFLRNGLADLEPLEVPGSCSDLDRALLEDENLMIDDSYPLDRARMIERACQRNEEQRRRQSRLEAEGWDVDRLVRRACRWTGADEAELRAGRRSAAESTARSVVAHLGTTELGLSHTTVARAVGVSRPAISKMRSRGRAFVESLGIRLDSTRGGPGAAEGSDRRGRG